MKMAWVGQVAFGCENFTPMKSVGFVNNTPQKGMTGQIWPNNIGLFNGGELVTEITSR